MPTIVPQFKYNTPKLNHDKLVSYIDYPIAFNEVITQEPFYVGLEWTFATSDATNTQLYKWNGNGWTEVLGWDNPETFYGRGFFAVSTAVAASVTITEYNLA